MSFFLIEMTCNKKNFSKKRFFFTGRSIKYTKGFLARKVKYAQDAFARVENVLNYFFLLSLLPLTVGR